MAYRAEMASKMRDSGEEDDWDWESLADKILEQAELAKGAHRVGMTFLDSLDAEMAEAIIRNKVDGIPFDALAKRTGKTVQARLRMRISRAYRKMRRREFRLKCGGISFTCIMEAQTRWTKAMKVFASLS